MGKERLDNGEEEDDFQELVWGKRREKSREKEDFVVRQHRYGPCCLGWLKS